MGSAEQSEVVRSLEDSIQRNEHEGRHEGRQCSDEHAWAYTGDLDEEECASKCKELDCTCYDHQEVATRVADNNNDR